MKNKIITSIKDITKEKSDELYKREGRHFENLVSKIQTIQEHQEESEERKQYKIQIIDKIEEEGRIYILYDPYEEYELEGNPKVARIIEIHEKIDNEGKHNIEIIDSQELKIYNYNGEGECVFFKNEKTKLPFEN